MDKFFSLAVRHRVASNFSADARIQAAGPPLAIVVAAAIEARGGRETVPRRSRAPRAPAFVSTKRRAARRRGPPLSIERSADARPAERRLTQRRSSASRRALACVDSESLADCVPGLCRGHVDVLSSIDGAATLSNARRSTQTRRQYENASFNRARARYRNRVRPAAGGFGRSRDERRPSLDAGPPGRECAVLLPWPQLLLVRRRLAGPGLVLVRLRVALRLWLGRRRWLAWLEPRSVAWPPCRGAARAYRPFADGLRPYAPVPCAPEQCRPNAAIPRRGRFSRRRPWPGAESWRRRRVYEQKNK